MRRVLFSTTGLLLLVVAFIAFTLVNNVLFSGARVDLTENGLYTLADGTLEIVERIDEPINLYFFFSERASEDLTALRNYARRVQELLEEYALHAHGKINLQVIDPEPFSEAEDQASEFGLQGVPVNASGDELYFGLAATNALDDLEVIPFFQPDREEFLEYELSKLVQSLIDPKRPVVGLLSSLKVQGDMDMTTFQSTPPWMVVSQIEQLFEIRGVDAGATSIPGDVDLLLVIHPKGLSEDSLYAIDQFVMRGGRLLVFEDPLAESDRPQQNPMMPTPPAQQSSELNRLLGAWGVTMRADSVLTDAQTALTVNAGSGGPVRHLAILGLQPENFSSEDVITSSLENVNLATAGILEISADASTTVTPLITSSPYAMAMESLRFQFLSDPAELQRDFSPSGESYVVAARITGPADSAFPEGIEGATGEQIKHADAINVVVVADTDILTDRLWVQVQSFFGRRIAAPFADNGAFVVNALDNLVGSSSLISIRSRGRFSRPFDVVLDLKREAEARYLESANDLQARLNETERKLSELQQQKEEQSLLTLSPEQQAALGQFQEEKLQIRKQLRDVRHQLDSDIERLGSWLKFINIALVPILLTLAALVIYYLKVARERG